MDEDKKEIIGDGSVPDITKLTAAMRILLAVAILYVFTIICYMIVYFIDRTNNDLLSMCQTVYPPLASFILGYLFKGQEKK